LTWNKDMPPRIQQANMYLLGCSSWIVIADIRADYGIYTLPWMSPSSWMFNLWIPSLLGIVTCILHWQKYLASSLEFWTCYILMAISGIFRYLALHLDSTSSLNMMISSQEYALQQLYLICCHMLYPTW
jgi:hypothetical protein